MSTIRTIRVLSLLIMAAAAAVSYQTQRHLFGLWGVDVFTAAVAPIAVDLLAIICTVALHADGVARKGIRAAIVVLILTGSGSTAANFIAGQSPGSKVVHASMVVLYLMAEWIASTVRDGAAHAAPQAPAMVPANAPVSPGFAPIETEPAEVLAFRQAAGQLRRTSALPALNKG